MQHRIVKMQKCSIFLILLGLLLLKTVHADYPLNPRNCCIPCPYTSQELCFWNDTYFLYMSIDPDGIGHFCGDNDLTVIQDTMQYSTVRGYDEQDEYVCDDIFIYRETRLAESRYDSESPFDSTRPLSVVIERCESNEQPTVLEYPSECTVLTTTTTLSVTSTTSSVPASGAVIIDKMISKDVLIENGCETPAPADTFFFEDEAAYCWFKWNNATESEEIIVRWYMPNGELYTTHTTQAMYSSGCWFPGILIMDHMPSYTLGRWYAAVYMGGVKKFEQEFFITDILTTSSSTTSIPEYTVSGQITGDVMSNVSVHLTGRTSITAHSAHDGQFTFHDLDGGYYRMTPEYDGCVFEPPQYIIQSLTSHLSEMDFKSICRPCPTTNLYGRHSEQYELIRRFRDNVLKKSPEGQEIIKLYYQWAPTIVEVMEEDEESKEAVRKIVDEMMPMIRSIVE